VAWPARSVYHLMLNTSLGDKMVVQMILGSVNDLEEAAHAKQTQGTAG